MVAKGASPQPLVDPCVLVGQLAGLLAEGAEMPAVLGSLVAGLGLRTAVLRGAAGVLLGVGGEVLYAVPQMRELPATTSSVELPVPGGATLTVLGARPTQLPVLRAVAAVLGLALAGPPAHGGELLLGAAEADQDALADALHDGPVQSLVVARYAADAAVRGGDAVCARDAVQQALIDVRRTLWHLRPRGTTGLVEALRQLTEQVAAAGGPTMVVRGDGDARGAAAVLVFRLVQAVARVDAPVVRLHLQRDGADLLLTVAGGAPLQHPERWSLRARALGGDLAASGGRLRLALPSDGPDALTPDGTTLDGTTPDGTTPDPLSTSDARTAT